MRMSGTWKIALLTVVAVLAFAQCKTDEKRGPGEPAAPGMTPATMGGPREPARRPARLTRDQVKRQAAAFLKTYQADLAKVEKVETLAFWKASNSGKKADFKAAARAMLALKQLHADAKRHQRIVGLLAHRETFDPLTRRALEVAELAFKGNQLPKDLLKKLVSASTEIEREFNTFRGKIGEKAFSNNQLLVVLRKERDHQKRKQAWEALKQVGAKVAPKVVALAKLRNVAAKKLGFANFWEMKVRLKEYDPKQLLAVFAELATLTDKPFLVMKAKLDAELARRFGIKPVELMPWHYSNPFFQSPPPSEALDLDEFYKGMKKEDIVALTQRFFADIGIDIRDILQRSDLYERRGKNQHAFCTSIDRSGDVRVLANVKPTAAWMDTMLHELGHAVYDKLLDLKLPFNLREPAHMFTTEAVAMLFGALAKNPTWLTTYAKADKKRISKLLPAILAQRRREQLIFARWTLVMLHFEKGLYENPGRDLNRLWWDLVERYQGLRRPPERNQPDWAAKPHIALYPVYYHNYMMGELYAAQLRRQLVELAEHNGPTGTLSWTGKKKFGQFLTTRLFRLGKRHRWPTFIEKTTGHPLSAKYFADEVR